MPGKGGGLVIIATLAHPHDERAQERFVHALWSGLLRGWRTQKHENIPTELRKVRDRLTARDERAAVRRAYDAVTVRQQAHWVMMEAQRETHEVVHAARRYPEKAMELRRMAREAAEHAPPQLASRGRGTDFSVERELKTRLPATINEVLRNVAEANERDHRNLRRDIWNPSISVLPIARWLEVRMAPPYTVNGEPQALRLPHTTSASSDWRTPDLTAMILSDGSWVSDCLTFTDRMIANWPKTEGRYPALKDIDPAQFIHLVAE